MKILLFAVLLIAPQVRAAEPTEIDLLGPDSEVRTTLLMHMASHQDVESGQRFLESIGFRCEITRSPIWPFFREATQRYLHCERSVSRIRELVVWHIALFPQSGPILGVFIYPVHIYM